MSEHPLAVARGADGTYAWTGSIHGIGIRVVSPDRHFILLVDHTLRHFRTPEARDPRLQVQFEYATWKRPAASNSGLPWRMGTDLYSDGRGRLSHLDHRGTYVELDASNSPWRVRAVHTEACYQTLMRWARLRPPVHLGNRQIGMRLSIHTPVFRQLAQQGVFAIHAATVERGGRALVFAGLNGCGKSGIALALCRTRGFRLLADNFTPHDGRLAYEFPETLRLAEGDTAGLSLTRAPGAPVFGKSQYIVDEQLVGSPCEPAAIFYTVLDRASDVTVITEVPAATMHAWIEAAHAVVGELPEQSYLRMLDLCETASSPTASSSAALSQLLSRCRVYLLRLSTRMSREASAEEVLKCC